MAEQTSQAPEKAGVSPFPVLNGLKIIKEKGRSPRGIIYKARRLVEDDIVAVKVFHPQSCAGRFVEQLPHRAEQAFGLERRGLVKCLGCSSESGYLLLMMEYAPGQPLSSYLHRHEHFSPHKAVSIALLCAKILRFAAFKNFCHGRLHPNDIILGKYYLHVLGVGLGERPEAAAFKPGDGYLFEPLIYTAPEAMPSLPFPKSNQAAADIYSLGAILFHLLSGTPPFRGTDETAIAAERKSLRGPVAWPAHSYVELPPEAMAFTDRMMAADPAARPAYDATIDALTRILASLPGKPSGAALAAGSPVSLPAPVLKTDSRPQNLRPVPTTSGAGRDDAEHRKKKAGAPKSVAAPADSRLDRVLTVLLALMTAGIFACALVLAGRSLIDESPGSFPPRFAGVAPGAAVDARPSGAAPLNPAAVTPPAEGSAEEQALALRQLELVQDMMKGGELQNSEALLKLVNGVADRAGRATITGIRAALLASQLEGKLSRGSAATGTTGSDVAASATPVAAVPPAAPAAKTPPPPEVPPAAMAPNPEPKAIENPNPADWGPAASAVKQAMQQAKNFHYGEARDALEKFAAGASPNQKNIADSYGRLLKQEQGLFERSRARLVEQIQRHPRHESKLQVFPRKEDPNGDDIVDFDENGLKISTKSKASSSAQVLTMWTWNKFPPIQVLNMFQLLAARDSLDDQLSLAVFAFNRGLKQEQDFALAEARALPNGAIQAEQLAAAFKNLSSMLEGGEPHQP